MKIVDSVAVEASQEDAGEISREWGFESGKWQNLDRMEYGIMYEDLVNNNP